MTQQTSTQDLRAALSMLESGRGIPVHLECVNEMGTRWDRFLDNLNSRQYELETGRNKYLREHLVDDIGGAVAAISTLLNIGGGGYGIAPRVGVAYKDTVQWFEATRAALQKRPPKEIDDLITHAHVVHQHGTEKLYELAETTIEVPELDDTGILPDESLRRLGPFHLDAGIAAARLREVLTQRMGLPEVPRAPLRSGSRGELGSGGPSPTL